MGPGDDRSRLFDSPPCVPLGHLLKSRETLDGDNGAVIIGAEVALECCVALA